MAQELLAPQTAAAASSPFKVSSEQNGNRPVSVMTTGLAGAENADVQFSVNGGSIWNDLFQDGSQVRLTAINNSVTIYGPGLYRVDKEATAGAAGVFISTAAAP